MKLTPKVLMTLVSIGFLFSLSDTIKISIHINHEHLKVSGTV